jgi:hypothetical protein
MTLNRHRASLREKRLDDGDERATRGTTKYFEFCFHA